MYNYQIEEKILPKPKIAVRSEAVEPNLGSKKEPAEPDMDQQDLQYGLVEELPLVLPITEILRERSIRKKKLKPY